MELFLKQIMRGKDMLLRKNKIIIFLFFIFFNNKLVSQDIKITNLNNYIEGLRGFSATFIQESENIINEGQLFIGNNRVRVEYYNPSKILIILDDNKAMYYNYDLDEVEFFNPKNTTAWYFFEIFKNKQFLDKSKISSENKNIIISKSGVNGDIDYSLNIYFEEVPMVLRKIELITGGENFIISLGNHNYNEIFDKNFFKLINPKLL